MDVCVVCCTVRTKDTKAGQSGQRSLDKVQTENKKKPRDMNVRVVCFKQKQKGKMPDSQDKDTSTDEVQTENKGI
jgi:hypothetical protein